MTEHEERPTPATKAALLQRDMDTIKIAVTEIKATLANQYVPNHQLDLIRLLISEINGKITALSKAQELYVTKADFSPVRVIVYGLVGLVLLAFGKFIVDGAIKQPDPEHMQRRGALIAPVPPDNTALRNVPDLSN